jgi:hypothetical protein
MNWTDSLAALSRLLRLTRAVGAAAAKADPALKESITLSAITRGVAVAESLPWADMAAALESHFSDPDKTISTVEEVLQALAPFIPGVIPFEEAAQVIGVLCKLNLVKVQHGLPPPLFGSDGPQYQHPPFI